MSNTLLLRRISAAYQKVRQIKNVMFSKKYLLFTNMGISVSLSGIGDMIQQHYMILQGRSAAWDRDRTHHMSITGLTVGIVCHSWYMFLDRRLPGRTVRVVFKKLLVDQLFFSPVCIAVFFLTYGFLDGSSSKEIAEEIVEKGKQLYVAEWVVWPPAQLINFYFLPTQYRILYDSTISLGYDIYTSYIKHDGKSKNVHVEKKK